MSIQENQTYLPTDLPKEIPAVFNEEPTSAEYPNSQNNSVPYSHEVKTLLEWKAPGRPFKKRRKEYYLSALLIVLLLEIIAFLFSQYLLMLVIASLLFVAFALVSIPPHDFSYKISTEGITIEDHFYLWQELYDFYFKKRDGSEVLLVRTRTLLPTPLTLTLGDLDKEKVKQILLPYLPFREVIKPTFMEKSADWLSKNFPLERNI